MIIISFTYLYIKQKVNPNNKSLVSYKFLLARTMNLHSLILKSLYLSLLKTSPLSPFPTFLSSTRPQQKRPMPRSFSRTSHQSLNSSSKTPRKYYQPLGPYIPYNPYGPLGPEPLMLITLFLTRIRRFSQHIRYSPTAQTRPLRASHSRVLRPFTTLVLRTPLLMSVRSSNIKEVISKHLRE